MFQLIVKKLLEKKKKSLKMTLNKNIIMEFGHTLGIVHQNGAWTKSQETNTHMIQHNLNFKKHYHCLF
jgi:hypothetical protein